MKTKRRKAIMHPRSDRWHCVLCHTYTRVVEIEVRGGFRGASICIPCLRAAGRKAMLLPSGGG